MILTPKKQICKKYCKCEKCNPVERYDASADVNAPLSLEEHFENFTDTVAEVTENFLGLGKKAKAKRVARQERKKERQETRQEKRISRIKTRQNIRETKAGALKDRLTIANEGLGLQNEVIKQQAQTQADQVNQLASQVQPDAKPISASQTPTASESSAPLYQTLPDAQEAPQEAGTETAKGIEAPTTETPKKSKTMVYIIIAVAVIGAYYLMKKK